MTRRSQVLPRAAAVLATVVSVAACLQARSPQPTPPADTPAPTEAVKKTPDPPRPVLSEHFLVTWYGNPRTGRMGILGRHQGADLAARLKKQAEAYAPLTGKKVLPAYHLVATIAQPAAGKDSKWRRRETKALIRSLLDQARTNGFKLILDIQPGRSTVRAEMEYLKEYLEDPDVYLALDPEFAMPEGEIPGRKIGRMTARDVNDAIEFLDKIIREKNLPPKVLIVHQFTMNMLRDKHDIGDSPLVDVVLDMDGFGDQPLKKAMYKTIVARRPLEFPAIKLFYKEDTNLMGEKDVMKLEPEPAVVIYQ
jgi:hypothetical protein